MVQNELAEVFIFRGMFWFNKKARITDIKFENQ